jgi:hypothetical protein
MMVRKGLVSAAAAVLALGSAAFADDSSLVTPSATDSSSQVSLLPVLADDTAAPAAPAGPTSTTPLMYLLGTDSGLGKFLADTNINITGYGEGGYLYDLSTPGNPAGRQTFAGDKIVFPGAYKDELILDQFDLAISRAVDATKGKFDIGFTVEGIYGRDAFFTHSNGILDQDNKRGGGAKDQLDLFQAYLTFAVPVGSGLTIQAGKFTAYYANETVEPTNNQFYSHSYIFGFGTPISQTGVTGTYAFTDKLTVTGGVSRGWSESTDDNNGAIDGIWEAVYKATDKLTLTFNGSVGPEGVPGTVPYGPKDNKHYWVVPELIAAYQASDQLKVAADLLYGDASSYDQWYGAAGYAGYTLNSYLTLNGRLEFYSDGKGLTTGAATTTNYAEGTIGVQIKPFPNSQIFQFLQFRPEVREDIADHAALDGKFNQLTVAVDAIMQF